MEFSLDETGEPINNFKTLVPSGIFESYSEDSSRDNPGKIHTHGIWVRFPVGGGATDYEIIYTTKVGTD